MRVFDWKEEAYLNNAVHVWDEAVDSDLKQHHQCSTNILPDLRVFICSQRKQTLSNHRKTSQTSKKQQWEKQLLTTNILNLDQELPQ